jgi:hypothetical protein
MIQNADSEIWQPKFCLDAWNKGTGWGNRPTEWNFPGLWPWHVVKLVGNFDDFSKEGNKRKRNFADLSPQTSPHGHKRTLTQNNFETNSAGKLSLANFARKSSQFYSLYKSTNWQGVQ